MLSAILRFCSRHAVLIQLVTTLIGLFGGGFAPIQVFFGGSHVHWNGEAVSVVPSQDGAKGAGSVIPRIDDPDVRQPAPTTVVWPPRADLSFDQPSQGPHYVAHPTITKKAGGHVFVLSDDFCWRFGQEGTGERPQVELAGTPQAAEAVVQYLMEPGLQTQLQRVTDVVAVGMASCEGKDHEERWRAEHRSEMLAFWLRKAKGSSPALVWRLNLGRHQHCPPGATPESTRRQRPVLFVALIRHPETKRLSRRDLLEAIQSAQDLELDPRDYLGGLAF